MELQATSRLGHSHQENILVWYEEERISEDVMRNAIEWLMNQEILNDDYLEEF